MLITNTAADTQPGRPSISTTYTGMATLSAADVSAYPRLLAISHRYPRSRSTVPQPPTTSPGSPCWARSADSSTVTPASRTKDTTYDAAFSSATA